jgi:hypothetical protein
MNSKLLLSLFVGLFTATTWAQSPVEKGVEAEGYESFPVLQCPATNEAIKQFRTKLLDLKKAIKSEANCKGIEADVAGLSSLVTKEREDIVALINKGQTQGLTDQEQGKVETYVQNLTEKTSNLVAVITGNDACFDEDKKGMSLDFITSLIGEGSKILAIVGGPEVGATIQVAGEVITGFLKAMKAIQNNRQGYKFKDPEQRMAYAESLCSLFDYRRELNKLIDPYDSVERLQELNTVLTRQIKILRQNCLECRSIINMVENSSVKARETKAEYDITMDDLWPKELETTASVEAKKIDKLYVRKLGTHTYRTLKTLAWIPLRIRALENSSLKADLGLEDVISEMASIEKFMVTEQAGDFMKQLLVESSEWNQKIQMHLMAAGYSVSMLRMEYRYLEIPKPTFNWITSQDETQGYLLEVLDVAREQVSSADRALIRTYFKDLENLARSLTIATDVAQNYCVFFELADWYKPSIHRQCNGSKLRDLRSAANKYTNYKMLMPSNRDSALAEPVVVESSDVPSEDVVAKDWVDSLTRVVEDMTQVNDYVRRKDVPLKPH